MNKVACKITRITGYL